MIDVKRFSGVLNTDDNPEDVLQPQHISAKNVCFRGGQNGLTVRNIKGNYVVPNNELPVGTNECIGSFFDSVRQRIIWFNYNSNGDNGIYQLSIQTGAISKIFLCNTDSASDILNFSLDYPVHSVNIVYRPSGDGDLIYWTDGYNKPKYLNLDTVATLAPFTNDMITAAKNAPGVPPTCQYGDNLTITTNNLRKKLFRFCYRWVYKNGEKSTFSPISKVALPVNGYDLNVQNDPRYNNNISISVLSGGDDSQAIEIAGQTNIDNVWGDFFLIDKVDMTEYNISPNSSYSYYFYNNSSYNPINPQETDLYFSFLPNKANTLELLNGNVIIYGGITDGYDNLKRSDVDVTVTTGVSSGQGANQPSISVTTILGPGGNPDGASLQFTVGNTIVSGAVYHIEFTAEYKNSIPGSSIYINKLINYTTPIGATQASVVTGLIAALYVVGEPLIYTDNGNGSFTVSINPAKYRRYMYNAIVYVVSTSTGSAQSAWKWGYSGRLGLVYYDEIGKTNGVISYVSDNNIDNTDFGFTTSNFLTLSNVPQIPYVAATINHTPPTWAKTYQWVRSNNLPISFIQYVTCDYSNPNDGFLYFCIQNLLYQKTVDTGFVPSYEFKEGDRVKILGNFSGGNITSFTDQLDFEILGTVEKTMTSPNPAVDGLWLKVANPNTIPAYGKNLFIEIYTPRPITEETQTLFYEWGEEFAIYESGGNRYHRGQTQDQTATQPAAFQWFNGNVYYKPRRFYPTDSNLSTQTKLMMDANYSDYFQSAVNSDGRGWVINENAKEAYYPVTVRWGGNYQYLTDVNNLNIFRPNDTDVVDRVKGDIRRFKTRDRILRVFQDRGVGQYGVYARFIQNNQGQSELVTTNEIITTNNIQYYMGTYGLGGYATNLTSSPRADYFNDIVTGHGIRLASDGITDLGLTYKGQFYFPSLVTPYNKQLLRANSSISKVMGYWDSFQNEWHTILQEGTGDGTTTPNSHWSFNETRNGYCCDEYGFIPEWALSANDIVYTWKNGQIYKHDSSTYCNFYGVQDSCHIKVVFNKDLMLKKSWNAISEVSSDIWSCPEIYTNTKSYSSQNQQTTLVQQEFGLLENMPSAPIKRDANSSGGKVNGDYMKGNYMVIKFEKQSASDLVTLSELLMRYTISPKTDR